MLVTRALLVNKLVELDLSGQDVAVHSSLSSFGCVQGGAQTVIEALAETCGTVLAPAFNFDTQPGWSTAPPDDRPRQNGLDYASHKVAPASPFDPDAFDEHSSVDREIGVIPRTLLQAAGATRSKFPGQSWAALGKNAAHYLVPHPLDDPLLPLKRLYDNGGSVLLLGCGLASCTALHLAEERAGRRAFIRWIKYSDGVTRRVRLNGCSDGFVRLTPGLESVARRARIGSCEAVVYPMRQLVDRAAEVMRQSPDITLCSENGGQGCQHCVDAVRGGPIEKSLTESRDAHASSG